VRPEAQGWFEGRGRKSPAFCISFYGFDPDENYFLMPACGLGAGSMNGFESSLYI
jgi:hypothetical protein